MLPWLLLIFRWLGGDGEGARQVSQPVKTSQPGGTTQEIHLLVQWYRVEKRERNLDLATAICANLVNQHITKIHFLQRDDSSAEGIHRLLKCRAPDWEGFRSKVTVYRLPDKPVVFGEAGLSTAVVSFAEAMAYANEHLPRKTAIFANLDIRFDDTLWHLTVDREMGPGMAYFLSRWERPKDESAGIGTQCGPKYIGSHDAFVFQAPLPPSLVEACSDLPIGVSGVENLAMFEFWRAGYQVRNPCERVKAWHCHSSQYRVHRGYELNHMTRTYLCPPISSGLVYHYEWEL